MAAGNIYIRCKDCRREGKSGFYSIRSKRKCSHKDKKYGIAYRVGRQQKREIIGPNRKDAERRLYDVISQINNGTYRKPNKMTFGQFTQKWLADYAKNRIKARTYISYESSIRRHMFPSWKNTYLTSITQEDVQKLMADLLKNFQPKTVNNVLKLSKTIFKYARRWKYVSVIQFKYSFTSNHIAFQLS